MATVTQAAAAVWTTAAGNKTTASFTPVAGDLLVVISLHSAQDGASTITDTQSGTYNQVGTLPSYSTAQAGTIGIYLRTSAVSATSMTVTSAPAGTSTGGGLYVLRVAGAQGYGSAAYRHEGVLADQAAGTPAPVLAAAANPANVLIGVVCTNTNGSANCAPPAGWAAEDIDQGYNTPPSGIEVCHINSGETLQTITFGATTPSQFGVKVIEIIAPQTISAAFIDSSGATFAPEVTAPTAQTVTASLINQAGVMFAPAVEGGLSTPLLKNNAEGGSNGTTVTPANSGGTSGDAFATVNNAVTFDNTYPSSGSLGYKYTRATTETVDTIFSDLGTSQSTIFVRFYLRFDAVFGSSNLYLFTAGNGAANVARLNLNFSRLLRMYNQSGSLVGSGTVTLALSTLYRVEYKIIGHATAGAFELRVFEGNATTPVATDSVTGLTMTNNVMTRFAFGPNGTASGFTAYMDDLAISNDTWIGPAGAGPQNVSPGLIDQSGATFAPTLLNPQTVTVPLIDRSGATSAPEVTTPGPQNVTVGLINQAGALFAPSVNQTVFPDLIGAFFGGYGQGYAGDGYAIFAPSVLNPQTVTVGFIAQTGVTFAPQVNQGAGAQTVTAPLVNQTGATFAPVLLNPQTVTVGLIDQTGATFAPSFNVAGGPQSVSPPLLSYGQVFTPEIRRAALVDPPFIVQTGSTFAPNVSIPSSQSVTVGLISRAGATFAPSVSIPGSQSVTIPLISRAGTLFSPAVLPAQLVTAPLISSIGTVFTVTVASGEMGAPVDHPMAVELVTIGGATEQVSEGKATMYVEQGEAT